MKLEIRTPEKSLFAGEVTSLRARAVDGEIGILPNHAPLVTMLETGKIKFSLPTKEEVTIESGQGFLIVRKNQVNILLRA